MSKSMEISKNNCGGWSELLDDLTYEIQKRLTLVDLIRNSSVCSSWNSISDSFLRHRGRLPWLIVPFYVDPNVERDANYCSDDILGFFSILDDSTYKLEIPELVGRRICGTAFGTRFSEEKGFLYQLQGSLDDTENISEFPLPTHEVDVRGQVPKEFKYISRTNMVFHGLKKAHEHVNLIAYLKSATSS
ncbi:hypothetical protein IFM89_028382 [Coptis chinensis]|uniref:F-box domain-containing protein n=1 Tax=Coptis chinensis TaxID=261450 RepID=A0A835LG04_9MAGN|nr:hypothetical protein IFM89_028382 [Coptis chinensis]